MAELRLLEGEGAGGVFALDRGAVMRIGRDPQAGMTLSQGKVSGLHAKVSFLDGGWVIEDNKSTNGTFVNGRKIAKKALHHGDTIKIGPFVIRFSTEEGAKTSRESGEEVRVDYAITGRGKEALLEAASRLKKASAAIADEMSRVIVGQKEVVDDLLLALFARGHVLLVGVPGLAKTLMVRTLSGILELSFADLRCLDEARSSVGCHLDICRALQRQLNQLLPLTELPADPGHGKGCARVARRQLHGAAAMLERILRSAELEIQNCRELIVNLRGLFVIDVIKQTRVDLRELFESMYVRHGSASG